MATDFQKAARKANRVAQKSIKRTVKNARKQTKKARKGLEKSYSKLSFGQKVGVYGALIAVVAVASAIFGRVSR